MHDFLSLAKAEDAQWLVGEAGREVLRLFNERQLAEEFCSLDLGVLRKMLWARAFVPPGFEEEEAKVKELDVSGVPCSFECGQEKEDGGRCRAMFGDRRAMLAHVKLRHGFRCLYSTITVTNQCCYCMSVFASKLRNCTEAHLAGCEVGSLCRKC